MSTWRKEDVIVRFAVVESGFRQYIFETFSQHSDFCGEIAFFVEQTPKNKVYKNIPILSLKEIKYAQFDALLIAVSLNHHLQQLLEYLHENRLSNIFIIRPFALETHVDFIKEGKFDDAYVDKILKKDDKPYLVHLETHVCDHCNLNCKACEHFSPFVKERVVAKIADFELALVRLSKLFSNIGRFALLGGEPLLEPELCCEMIKLYRSYFPKSEFRLLTNATLTHQMSPEFWRCLRENGVIYQISLYPPMWNRLEVIESILRDNDITYLLAGRLKRTEKFLRRMTRYPFEDANISNRLCRSAGCHYLREGSIFKCPDSILVGYMAPWLDCTPEELQTREKIDLAYETDGWSIIHRLNAPSDMCKKCALQRAEQFDWGITDGKPDPKDWLLENRFEYENRILNEHLGILSAEKLTMEAKLQKAEASAAQWEIDLKSRGKELITVKAKYQEVVLESAQRETELKNKNIEISNLKQTTIALHEELNQANGCLRNKERVCRELHDELVAVQSSLSFRLGRSITLVPRWIREKVNGVMKSKNSQQGQ